MPKLRTVEAWPATRHANRPWHPDEDLAAFLAGSRGLFDLYSDELPAAEQSARASSIRLFLEDAKRPEGFAISVFERPRGVGFEMVHVAVPDGFSDLSAAQRARAALDVIHTAVTALAPLRGWDSLRLDEVRRRVEGRGLRFTWACDWKTSPSRRYQARGVFWLDDEGHGRVQVEVRRYADQTAVARSEPALAFMTAEGFKRSAATLHWHGADSVVMVPSAGLFGDQHGLVQLDASGPLALSALPGPIPAQVPVVQITTTVLAPDQWLEGPDQPWLHLEVIETVGNGSYGSEFQRVSALLATDADFAAWWAQTSFRSLRLRICVPDLRWGGLSPKAGARKNGKDLVLQIVTQRSDLPPKNDVQASRERAREDLHRALHVLATSRKLPAPPPLPTRLAMNAREWRAQAGE